MDHILAGLLNTEALGDYKPSLVTSFSLQFYTTTFFFQHNHDIF